MSPKYLTRLAGTVAAVAIAATGALTATEASAADAAYTGKVTGNAGVSIRQGPTAHSAYKGNLAKGTITKSIECKAHGQDVNGNRLWYKIGKDKWISAKYVANIGAVPKLCPAFDTHASTAQVTSSLTKRQGPSPSDRKLGSSPVGHKFKAKCYARGVSYKGTDVWYQLTDNSWVSKAQVKDLKTPPPSNSSPVPC